MANETSSKIDNNVWKTVSNKSQRIRKTNLINEIDQLAMPFNNVYKPLDVDFHRESSNEHDDESTLKEKETQRNTNSSKNNNIQRNITSRKRPEHCTTERYIENQCKTPRRKIVSGNRCYASTTDYGKKIFVVGDSQIKRISRKRFNNSFEKAKSFIKSFRGAEVQELEHYVVPHLNAQNPDVSVIHIGGNKINFIDINDINVKRIAEDTLKTGKKCANFGSEVFISSILIKRNIRLNSVIRKINDELQKLFKKYNFNYISNDEIGRRFVCDDGVHLSDNGMDI